MSRTLSIICFLFALNSLLAQGQSPEVNPESSAPVGQHTSLSGNVNNGTDAAIQLRFFTDYLSLDEQSFDVPIGPDGVYAMQFRLEEATVAYLSYYSIEIRLYLEPGDQLKIDFDAMNIWGSIHFDGKGSIHNSYLYEIDQAYRQWNNRAMLYEIAQREAMDYRRWVDRLHTQKLTFLREHDQRKLFSPTFAPYARADIDYWWAYQLMRYRIEHAVANSQSKTAVLPEEFYGFLNQVPISNDAALINQNYRYFLDQYLGFREEFKGKKIPVPFYDQTMIVTAPSMLVLERPDKPPVLAELKKGSRVSYRDEKSEERSKILIGDELQEDYWYKVRTSDGLEGWIMGVGVMFEKVDSAFAQRPNAYRGAAQNLRGKALEYMIATNLYWRSHLENTATFKEEVQAFLAHAEVPAYRMKLEKAMAEMSANAKIAEAEKPRVYYGSINYLVVREPEILSRKDAPAKEISVAPAESNATPKRSTPIKSEPALAATAIEKPKSSRSSSKKEKRRLAKAKRKAQKKAKQAEAPEPVIAAAEAEQPTVEAEQITATAPPISEAPAANPPIAKKATPAPRPQTIRPNPNPGQFIQIDPQPQYSARKNRMVFFELSAPLSRELKLVLYEDPIAFTERPCDLSRQSSTQYRGQLKYEGVKTGFLEYGGERAELYLSGNAPLTINFDPVDFKNTLRFTGTGSVANNWLVKVAQNHAAHQQELKAKIRQAAPLEFAQYLDQRRRSLQQALSDYAQEFPLPEAFQPFAQADIDYWYATQMLNYPWEHPLHLGQSSPMAVPDDYYRFFESLIISNDAALPNANYAYFLDAFMDYQLNLAANVGKEEGSLAEEQLNGKAWYFYRAGLLARDCKRGKALERGPEILAYIESCPYQSYNNLLRQVYNEAKGLANGDPAPGFRLQNLRGQEVDLSDYAGKIVYLDFWASWCSPCLMQMRNSSQWKSEFAQEEVVFLYVSLDKDTEAWRSFVRNNGFAGVHLKSIGGDVYQSKIARLYKVKRLPAVFLIDQQGR